MFYFDKMKYFIIDLFAKKKIKNQTECNNSTLRRVLMWEHSIKINIRKGFHKNVTHKNNKKKILNNQNRMQK